MPESQRLWGELIGLSISIDSSSPDVDIVTVAVADLAQALRLAKQLQKLRIPGSRFRTRVIAV